MSGLVALRFNECITAADLAGLAALMSADHRFVDIEGNVVSGKAACVAAWRGFFASFPGYRNVFSAVVPRPGPVDGHCAGDEVTEWRVHEDTPRTRRALGLAADQQAGEG
jgi:hypothetical protein